MRFLRIAWHSFATEVGGWLGSGAVLVPLLLLLNEAWEGAIVASLVSETPSVLQMFFAGAFGAYMARDRATHKETD